MKKIYGPIQFSVVAFDDKDVIPGLLERITITRELGIIRLIDFLFVEKDEDGEIEAIEISDYTKEEHIEFGALIGGLIGLGAGGEEGFEYGAYAGALAVAENDFGASLEDIMEIAEDIPPGKSAMIALFEHTWAINIKTYAAEHGGSILASGLIHPSALIKFGEELAEAVAREEERELMELEEEEKSLGKGTSTKQLKSEKKQTATNNRESLKVHPEL